MAGMLIWQQIRDLVASPRPKPTAPPTEPQLDLSAPYQFRLPWEDLDLPKPTNTGVKRR